MAGETFDVAVIGLGSAGLTAAKAAAQIGLKTVALERARLGGDCLWGGCVPTNTLLASAKVAATVRDAARFGVETGEVRVDGKAVWQRIRAVQEQIAETDDNAEIYEQLGIDLRIGPARMTGSHTIDVGGETIRARKIIIATGSSPRLPEITGLEAADPLTSESIWNLEAPPAEIVILGAGSAGVEFAQGLARIGSRVKLVHRGERILPKEEPSLAALLSERLAGDGVELIANATINEVSVVEAGTTMLSGRVGDRDLLLETPQLLVCCGRKPNVETVGLRAVGIDIGEEGVLTDDRSRTTIRTVYAVGDVAGRSHTHSAGFDAAQAVRDIALPGAGRRSPGVPYAIFTDPELGHAGLTFDEARETFPGKRVERIERDLGDSDRARIDGDPPGQIVAITVAGRLAGVHMLAPGASESLGGIQGSVSRRQRFTGLAEQVEVYPTRTIELQRLAGERALEFAVRIRNQIPNFLRR
ncbi:MAG: FAD-dependent oxidoreductase [Actinomycetes bacterium]